LLITSEYLNYPKPFTVIYLYLASCSKYCNFYFQIMNLIRQNLLMLLSVHYPVVIFINKISQKRERGLFIFISKFLFLLKKFHSKVLHLQQNYPQTSLNLYITCIRFTIFFQYNWIIIFISAGKNQLCQ
jgi:hypothetical protein